MMMMVISQWTTNYVEVTQELSLLKHMAMSVRMKFKAKKSQSDDGEKSNEGKNKMKR